MGRVGVVFRIGSTSFSAVSQARPALHCHQMWSFLCRHGLSLRTRKVYEKEVLQHCLCILQLQLDRTSSSSTQSRMTYTEKNGGNIYGVARSVGRYRSRWIWGVKWGKVWNWRSGGDKVGGTRSTLRVLRSLIDLVRSGRWILTVAIPFKISSCSFKLLYFKIH